MHPAHSPDHNRADLHEDGRHTDVILRIAALTLTKSITGQLAAAEPAPAVHASGGVVGVPDGI